VASAARLCNLGRLSVVGCYRRNERLWERTSMAFRYRKSIKIAKGLKLNLSKSGLSLSAGRPGASINIGPRGVKGTVGIPGTGLSWSHTIGSVRASRGGTSGMTIADQIEMYRSHGGVVAEFVAGMEQLVGTSLDSIRSYGKEKGYPVMLNWLPNG
jgi:hypothetical protein